MRLYHLLLVLLLLSGTVRAEKRVFVSLAGTLLEAEITAVEGDNVTLKRLNDEQTLVVNRKTLCKEDNVYIARWIGQNPEKSLVPASDPTAAPVRAPAIKFSLSCQTMPSKSDRGPPDGGMHVIELSYKFSLNNREVRMDLEKATGVVVTLGKNNTGPGNDLIVLQKEVFEVNIRAQSKMVYSTTPVRLTYYQGTPSYGVKSHGYVLIIRDSDENILFVEASPDGGSKFSQQILDLKTVPCVIDRDFKLKPDTTEPLGYISF